MAKLEYNETLVDNAIGLLLKGKERLNGTEENVEKAVKKIIGARGIQLIDTTEVQSAIGLATAYQDVIDNTILRIQDRVEKVKEYNKDVEDTGFFKRLFATAGFGLAKIFEGVGEAGEQLVDGFASGIGFVVGIFDKDAQNKIGEFVKKDHVGDAFQSLYNNQLSGVVKASYMKENGIGAKACKIFGTMLGYTAIMAAGGAAVGSTGVAGLTAKVGARAAIGSLKLGVGAAMVGSLGGTQQVCLQSGMSYNDSFKQGLKAAAISGVMVVGVNYAFRGLSKAFNTFKSNRAAKGVADVVDDVADDVVDDGIGSIGRNKGSRPSRGSSGNIFDDVADDATRTSGPKTNGASQTAGKTGSIADDILDVAGKSGDDLADDLAKAVRDGKITPDEAMKAVHDRAATAASKAEKIKFHPDRFSAKVESAAKAASGVADDGLGKAVNATANSADDVVSAATKTVANSTDDVASAATKVVANSTDDVVSAATKTVANSTDDVASAATKAVANSTDDVASAATKVVANSTDDVASAATKVVANSTDDVAGAATKAVANSTDDLAKAQQQALDEYQGLLYKREQAVQKLTDLGEVPGNAPKSQFDAVRSEINAIDDQIAVAGNKIADLHSSPSSTDMVPYNSNSKSLVPVEPKSEGLVPVTSKTETLVPVIPKTETLVPITPKTETLVPVTPKTETLVPVTPKPTGLVPVKPTPVSTTPVTPVVPTPKPPVLVTPIIGEPVPQEVEPVVMPHIDETVPIVPPNITTNTPAEVPTTVIPGGSIPNTPQVPTTETPSTVIPEPTQPVTPTPQTPVVTPPTEYAPIPNTGVSGTGRSLPSYVVPAAIGVAAGALGAMAASGHKKDEFEEVVDEDKDKNNDQGEEECI